MKAQRPTSTTRDDALGAIWDLVELVVRREVGGERVYLKRRPTGPKIEAIAAALAQRRPLGDAFAAAGVSRATGYRLCKRRRASTTKREGGDDLIDLVAKVARRLSEGLRDGDGAEALILACLHGTLDDVLGAA
jgi:hypothetical protein